VGQWAGQVQVVTGDAVAVALVVQGYTSDQPAQDAAVHGLQLEVVKLPEAMQGFVLLPCRWVVERRVAWTARVRRLTRDDERLPATLAGFHFLSFAILMRKRFVKLMT
jgi:transposase